MKEEEKKGTECRKERMKKKNTENPFLWMWCKHNDISASNFIAFFPLLLFFLWFFSSSLFMLFSLQNEKNTQNTKNIPFHCEISDFNECSSVLSSQNERTTTTKIELFISDSYFEREKIMRDRWLVSITSRFK